MWLIILSVFTIIFLAKIVKNTSKNTTISSNDYGRNTIKYSSILGVLSIALIVVYELFVNKTTMGDSLVDKVLDMQSITLAITGISISLISIISTVLTTRREGEYQKIENTLKENINNLEKDKKSLEKSITELKDMQEQLKNNSDSFTSLLLIESMFLEKRKEKLLYSLASNTESFFDKYFYITNLHKNYSSNATEKMKLSWYQAIIKQGEELLLKTDEFNITDDYNKTRKYMVLIILADAYFFVGESKIINNDICQDSEIESIFKKSEEYMDEADCLYADEDGYTTNSRGLIEFWKYKYYFSKGEVKKELLERSIDFYEGAIHKNSMVPQYYNNKGVSLLHKAKTETNPEKYWNFANKCFRDSLHLNKHSAKAALNIAAVFIDKIRQQLGVEKEIIILKNSDLLNDDKTTFYRYYKNAKNYLNNAMSVEPHFIDSYYKKAQLYIYLLLFKIKTDDINEEEKERLFEKIEYLFEDCDDINPNCRAVYYIKRMYYDVRDCFDEAIKVNKQIEHFNANNAEKWNECYSAFVNSSPEVKKVDMVDKE